MLIGQGLYKDCIVSWVHCIIAVAAVWELQTHWHDALLSTFFMTMLLLSDLFVRCMFIFMFEPFYCHSSLRTNKQKSVVQSVWVAGSSKMFFDIPRVLLGQHNHLACAVFLVKAEMCSSSCLDLLSLYLCSRMPHHAHPSVNNIYTILTVCCK